MNALSGTTSWRLSQTATPNQVNYVSWMIRLLIWDAPLAFCIAMTPIVLLTIFNHPRKAEPCAILVFIVVFILRYRTGVRQLASNSCSRSFKELQQFLFILAVVPFAFFECVFTMVVLFEGPKRLGVSWMLATFVVYYLSLMTIVMYPGRTLSRSKDQDDVFRLEVR